MTMQSIAPPVSSGDGVTDLPNTLEGLRSLLTEVRERVRRHRDTVDMRLECDIVRRMTEVAGSHVELNRELHGSWPGRVPGMPRVASAGDKGRKRLTANGGGLRAVSF